MKTSNKIAIALSVITISSMVLTGCKKSWLDTKPLSIYVPENTLVDIAGFRAAISSISNNIRPDWFGDNQPQITEQIFSEESVEGTDDKAGPAQNMDVQITPDAQLNNTDFNRIGYFWDREWVTVRGSNVIISNVPKATAISDSAKNVILGQTYFLRAFAYYRLVHQFGDVPAPMKEVTTPKTDFVTVKREVILQKMKADLEFAVKWVPWVTDKGDINRGACYHLLTKVNLALALFDDAIASATAVINQGTFKLMTARFGEDAGIATKNLTWDLHRPNNKALSNNTEGLYLTTDRFGTPGAFSGGTLMMRNNNAGISIGTNIVTPANRAGISPLANIEIDNMQIYGRGIGRCRSTSYFTKEIWDDVKDQRHDSTSGNWVYMENVRYSNPALKGVDTAYGLRLRLFGPTGNLLCSDTLRSWYGWPHYKNYIPDPEHTPMTGGHTDWYVFRLAETYLLRAEAYVWKGNSQQLAADDLNAVRTRAGASPYPASKMSISTILDERARELYFEEPRKTELTRISYIYAKTGIAADLNGKTYTLANFSASNFMYDRIIAKNVFYAKNFVTAHGDIMKISPFHVLWPVPQSAILANSDGHINQNIGYTGAAGNIPALDKIPD